MAVGRDPIDRILIASACGALLLGCLVTPASGALSNRQKALVRSRVLPAYFQHNHQMNHRLLTGLLQNVDPEELAEVDALTQAAGAPSVAEMLLAARLQQVLAGTAQTNVAIPADEAALILPALVARFDDTLDDFAKLEAEDAARHATIQAFQDAYWNVHVAQNRLQNAKRLAKFGVHLQSLAADSDVSADFTARAARLAAHESGLEQLKAELRVRGVQKASEIIRTSGDFKERLRASYVLAFDGPQVIAYLDGKTTEDFTRPLLAQPNLKDAVRAHVRLANEASGDLGKKSQLLYLALHWWMRGRYGLGPEGMGLLKSKAALSSPLAQFPLFMPIRPPTPTDPTRHADTIPTFDRRHHYIWMYEYRRLTVHRSSEVDVDRDVKEDRRYTSRTKLSHFY